MFGTVLSLYTGAGGFDLGLEAAGYRVVGAVESDRDARLTLRQHRPYWQLNEKPNIHDYRASELLREFSLSRDEVTILSAGPPCQPFSKSRYWLNGDSPRLDGARASTLVAFMNMVGTALPEVALLENVEGIGYRGKYSGARALLNAFSQINTRYGVNYQPTLLTVDAADYGVPQHRRRVFLVAFRDGRTFELPKVTHGPGPQGVSGRLGTPWR